MYCIQLSQEGILAKFLKKPAKIMEGYIIKGVQILTALLSVIILPIRSPSELPVNLVRKMIKVKVKI